MNSITQDMRFRLSIVKFYNRISATKRLSAIKLHVNLFISGFIVSMAISILLQTILIDPIIILISTRILKSNGSRILEEEILIWA